MPDVSAQNAQFISHVTKAGERWDLISWRYYGNPTLYSLIIQFNPQVPIEPVFETGRLLAVPVIAVDSSITAANDLPPWKRT